LLVDVNGDGYPDVIGFANDGIHIALGNGDATFRLLPPTLPQFGANAGWTVDNHPRMLADVNKDGLADVLGFANDGVHIAFGNGDGTFRILPTVLQQFGTALGWDVDRPRMVADLNGDGIPDIIGFANDGIHVALGNGNGTFKLLPPILPQFGASAGWNVLRPRMLADVNGDGYLDIIGFANDGVHVALGNGDGTFRLLQQVLPAFGTDAGWNVFTHPRVLKDVNGDGHLDIVGFANDGVRVALGNGDGTFQPI
jgi:hypothetical protein